jgi:hypothetical protein
MMRFVFGRNAGTLTTTAPKLQLPLQFEDTLILNMPFVDGLQSATVAVNVRRRCCVSSLAARAR